MAKRRTIYKLVFQGAGQIVELYARHVAQAAIFGFIEVEDLVFGARSELVVDPSEEALRNEYGEARRLFLPMHAILRIEEVEREGAARVVAAQEASGIVTPFPIPVWTPGKGPRHP
ncbi:MAG TPA: DUF1820 family protein [Thermoanaerobaculia bacterium]|nr:DUF1820 family protein [Thermoanaerobaculia bacterium]